MKRTLNSRNSTPSPTLSLTHADSEGPETTEKKASAAPSMEQHEEQANIINGWRLPESIGVIAESKRDEVQINIHDCLASEPPLITAAAPLAVQEESLDQTTNPSPSASTGSNSQHSISDKDISSGWQCELTVGSNEKDAKALAGTLQDGPTISRLKLVIQGGVYDCERQEDFLKRFCDAISASKTLNELRLDFEGARTMSLSSLSTALISNTSIKKLTLNSAKEWQIREVLHGLRRNSGVNFLELRDVTITDDALAGPICELYEANPRLTGFTIKGAERAPYSGTMNGELGNSPRNDQRKLGALLLLPNLSSTLVDLELDIRGWFDVDDFHNLAESFATSKQLRTLKLCLNDLPEHSATELSRALSKNPDLKDLAIDLDINFSAKYGNGGGAINFVCGSPQIRHLSITELKAQQQIDQLAESLNRCGRIESLSLDFPVMEDEETPIECSKLARMIAAQPSLTNLSLDLAGAELAGIELIYASINDSPSIQHLSLKIREDQVNAVCDLITRATKITTFNLLVNVLEQAAEQLAHAFEKNFSIVEGQISLYPQDYKHLEYQYLGLDLDLDTASEGDIQLYLLINAKAEIERHIQRNRQLLDAPLAGHGLQAMMELLPTSKPELPALPADVGSQLAAAAVMALNPEDAATVIRALKL